MMMMISEPAFERPAFIKKDKLIWLVFSLLESVWLGAYIFLLRSSCVDVVVVPSTRLSCVSYAFIIQWLHHSFFQKCCREDRPSHQLFLLMCAFWNEQVHNYFFLYITNIFISSEFIREKKLPKNNEDYNAHKYNISHERCDQYHNCVMVVELTFGVVSCADLFRRWLQRFKKMFFL